MNINILWWVIMENCICPLAKRQTASNKDPLQVWTSLYQYKLTCRQLTDWSWHPRTCPPPDAHIVLVPLSCVQTHTSPALIAVVWSMRSSVQTWSAWLDPIKGPVNPRHTYLLCLQGLRPLLCVHMFDTKWFLTFYLWFITDSVCWLYLTADVCPFSRFSKRI